MLPNFGVVKGQFNQPITVLLR